MSAIFWMVCLQAVAVGVIAIRKAKRSATKLRLLLTGPSGSGKTYGGLLVAKGLGSKRTIVIDTEQGSSDLYDRLHDFDVIDLRPPFTPEAYIEAIDAAEAAGADCIIIDSISHEWNGKGGVLELSDEIARAKFKGNTWSAWSELTPRHRAFIDRMLRSSAHIIATGRSKTETAQVDDHGRKKVVKLGMKIESRDGCEYEFTTVLDLIHDGHFAVASKDRTGIFSADPKPVTVETGKAFADWLAGGAAQEPAASPLVETIRETIAKATTVKKLGAITDRLDALVSEDKITGDEWSALTDEVNARHDEIEPATVSDK
jgi:threonine dehydrogenase-like Zn-dependent dehydrogenase